MPGRHTLRRACAACAKYKHSCDLATPRCSRCVKRKVECHYANAPSTALVASSRASPAERQSPRTEQPLAGRPLRWMEPRLGYNLGSVDPFESYPPTRLQKDRVQRLIHSFLHKIAFQYYPLDLDSTSNPFLVSWWPLALGDPALFHVSLQTACLDEELQAKKGFQTSEMLMADSVALLRRKVEDTELAVQDGTLNSIITLAAIEFGKGNLQASSVHVDGVKRLVAMRNGIDAVRQTSPLTARMVSWHVDATCSDREQWLTLQRVSLIVSGQPQFSTQDDMGLGDGVLAVPEWAFASSNQEATVLDGLDVECDVADAFTRLSLIFSWSKHSPMPSTRLHDLACFIAHRLLQPLQYESKENDPSSEYDCLRWALVLYMLILQGSTYFSHDVLQRDLVNRLMRDLELGWTQRHSSTQWSRLDFWLIGIGLVAAEGTHMYEWFQFRASAATMDLGIRQAADAVAMMKTVLWLEDSGVENVFRQHWKAVENGSDPDRHGTLAPEQQKPFTIPEC